MTIDEREITMIREWAAKCEQRSHDPAFSTFSRLIWKELAEQVRLGQSLLMMDADEPSVILHRNEVNSDRQTK